tara:strand:+ start:757 stop:1941 length:1185 start_codon:yes stop_codon:yes gene_type:complete
MPELENPTDKTDNVTVEQSEDELALNAKGRVKSLDDLLKQANVDRKHWRVTKWIANKWESLGKNGSTVPLWQVKAWLQRVPEWAHQIIEPVKHLPRKPSRGSEHGLKRALIIPDSQNGYKVNRRTQEHIPLHDRRAWDIAVQAAQRLQPDEIILLGDMLDLAPFGKYSTEPSLHYTTTPTLLELHWWLGQLRLAAPSAKITYLEGNHELRLTRMLTDHMKEATDLRPVDDPDGPPALSVPRLLALDQLDVEYIPGYPGGEYWLWDTVRAIHGSVVRQGSGQSTAAVIKDANCHTIFGHVHRTELCAKTQTNASRHNIIYAMSPGTIARLDGVVPGSTRRSNWQQGLGIVYMSPTEQVQMNLLSITDGMCVFDGYMLHGEDRTDEIRNATGYRWF